MKFYPTRYSEVHIDFSGSNGVDDIYQYKEVYTNYRFAGKFPDYAAIKREIKDFIDIEDSDAFDPVNVHELYDIPGIGSDPRNYGEIYEPLFCTHDIKYIVVIRRLSFYWFQVEIFEDRLSKIYKQMLINPPISNQDLSLTELLYRHKPIKCWKFRKFK